MKIEINAAYKNIELMKAEISGRSRAQRRLEIAWITISAMFISALLLCIIFLLSMTDWKVRDIPQAVAWPSKSKIKPIGQVIDEGWVRREDERFAPVEDSYYGH